MVLFFPSNYYCVRASKSRSTRFVMRSSLPMFSRWFPILLVGCCLVLRTDATLPFNISNPTKLLCYSCKGSRCETIANEDDNVILCDKHTQLCWAGFVDQQPYRTCSSRYCTPAGVSLDSDIRIEACCHASLCNSASLSSSIWNKWFKQTTTPRPETPTPTTARMTTRQKIVTTMSTTTTTPGFFIVNELLFQAQRPPPPETEANSDEKYVPAVAQPPSNASDPASFGIMWQHVSASKGLSSRLAPVSIHWILLVPMWLALFL